MFSLTPKKYAEIYTQLEITGTGYLAFKNTPTLIQRYVKSNLTLDYGCGSGRSTRFLKSLGLTVDGVDINQNMLEQAQSQDLNGDYQLICNDQIPANNEKYDFVFSSLVLFEIASLSQLIKLFLEVKRVLKKNGIFIVVTGSTDMYSHQWLSLDVNFSENSNLKSGDKAKIVLKDINLGLYDYFWTDEDYQQIMQTTGFKLLETDHPLGEDEFNWVSEKEVSPYVSYVMQKY